MLLLKRTQQQEENETDEFAHTKKYITDELELIQDQEENLIQVSAQLEKAFEQTEKDEKTHEIVKKTDQTIRHRIGDKRKQESGMINTFEDIKHMLKNQRYEDIEKRMLYVHHKSQQKVRLSQEELHRIREFMSELDEMYKECAGLCRLYQLVYTNLQKVYAKCQEEIGVETSEEVELSRAGAYTDKIHA